MASRAEQKAVARAAREARQHELRLAAARRTRMIMTGGIIGIAVVVLVIAIVVSSSGGHKGNPKLNASTKAKDLANVTSLLAGIPQAGNVLGKASAPITLTEYEDLVCPICQEFALTSEPQIISALVRTGQAKLVFRGFETASSRANGSEYVATQVAARSAGLQNLGWNYVLLTYQEQPSTIGGTPAEEVAYVTPKYLQDLAAQLKPKGLDLTKWQANTTNQTLINDVTQDGQAALAAGAAGTPTVVVTGPKGSAVDPEAVPTLAGIVSTIAHVS